MSEPVKFVDLRAQWADLEQTLVDAVAELIHNTAFVGGPSLASFEAHLAEFVGVEAAVGCSDGTAALYLSLQACGLKPGEGVIVPTNSFVASAHGVAHAGGVPVLVDCDPRTYLLDLQQVEDALKAGKASFVLPVHLYGNPCPMDDLMALAGKYGATVLEDNAQSIGASYKGKITGSFGRAAGVSFYPAKNLGCFGQGGAITTNDPDVAAHARMLINQGEGGERYYHEGVGYNGRLDSIQARVLDILLDRVDSFNAARLQAANWYAARLDPDRLQVRTPDAKHIYHLFEYRCDSEPERAALMKKLQAADIGCALHYPVPIHKQVAYPAHNHLSFPVAERLAETLVSLPMHPTLTEEQVDRVCQVVND